jgi:hypothetical protein
VTCIRSVFGGPRIASISCCDISGRMGSKLSGVTPWRKTGPLGTERGTSSSLRSSSPGCFDTDRRGRGRPRLALLLPGQHCSQLPSCTWTTPLDVTRRNNKRQSGTRRVRGQGRGHRRGRPADPEKRHFQGAAVARTASGLPEPSRRRGECNNMGWRPHSPPRSPAQCQPRVLDWRRVLPDANPGAVGPGECRRTAGPLGPRRRVAGRVLLRRHLEGRGERAARGGLTAGVKWLTTERMIPWSPEARPR